MSLGFGNRFPKDFSFCDNDKISGNKINRLKELGNIKFLNNQYNLAIKYYLKALSLKDLSRKVTLTLYNNISLSYIRLGEYGEGLLFCDRFLKLEAANIKTKIHKIKCLIELKRLEEANKVAIEMLQSSIDKKNKIKISQIFETLGDRFKVSGTADRGFYIEALSCFTKAIILQRTANLHIKRAKIFVLMERAEDANKDVNEALVIDPQNIEGRRLRFTFLEKSNADLKDLIEEARILYILAPNEAEMEQKLGYLYLSEGLEHNITKDFVKAFESFSKAIKHMPNPGFAYRNRAYISFDLGNIEIATKDCTEAIRLGFDNSELRALRAKCFLKGGKIQAAYEEVSVAYRMRPSNEYFSLMIEIQSMIPELLNSLPEKSSGQKSVTYEKCIAETFYSKLGLNEDATQTEIRKEFLKLSLKYHPDKLGSSSEKEKLEGVEKFKNILECYNILSNPESRKQYDFSLASDNNF